MTKRSGNHARASQSDTGEWYCEFCGAEGLDYELFEEAGVYENCLETASAGGPIKPADLKNQETINRAEAWIKQAARDYKSGKKKLTTINRSSIWESELIKHVNTEFKVSSPKLSGYRPTISWTDEPSEGENYWITTGTSLQSLEIGMETAAGHFRVLNELLAEDLKPSTNAETLVSGPDAEGKST